VHDASPVFARSSKIKHLIKGDNIMLPAKEEVRRLLDQLPDDTSLEDIQYHIYVQQKIDRGLNDVETGNTILETEFDKRMSKWLELKKELVGIFLILCRYYAYTESVFTY